MTGMDCCICYETALIKCFAGCDNHLCIECMIKLIEINKADMLFYTCPCCRKEIIKNINEDFTDFCNREIEILKRFVSLLEKNISTKRETHLAEVWTMFQATIMDIEDDVEEYNASTSHYIEFIQTGYLER